MLSSKPTRVVVTDANVLINLIHAGRPDLLGTLTVFEFVAPDHVVAEITVPAQRQALEIAFTAGALRQESITDPWDWPFIPNSGALWEVERLHVWRWQRGGDG